MKSVPRQKPETRKAMVIPSLCELQTSRDNEKQKDTDNPAVVCRDFMRY